MQDCYLYCYLDLHLLAYLEKLHIKLFADDFLSYLGQSQEHSIVKLKFKIIKTIVAEVAATS